MLTARVKLIFTAISLDPGTFIGSWLLPCGAAGAVLGVLLYWAAIVVIVFPPAFGFV